MSRHCQVRQLYRVTYENGTAMQESLVARRQREEIPDQLLLLEHSPVITLGRGGKHANLLASAQQLAEQGVRFYETTRGGDITYHGPGQLVGYPILHLGEGNRDVRKYVTRLEDALIRTLADFGVQAVRSSANRGVWIGKEKIAAIGIRIARWVTSHGFALNVNPLMDHFRLINPCGLDGYGVTSMEEAAGSAPTILDVADAFTRHFADLFERQIERVLPDLRLATVIAHDGDRVLLLKKRAPGGGFWQPVTGKIKAGESAGDAAKRELFEETGCRTRVEDLNLMQSFMIEPQYIPDAVLPLFADEAAFEAKIDSSSSVRLDQEEHDTFGWFTFAEAYEKIRWTDDREAINALERRLKSLP